MKKIILSLIVFMVISCFTFAQENVEIQPTADSYIYSGNREANYGKEQKIRVARTPKSTVLRHTYLKFDISSIGTTSNKVVLKLYCNAVDDPSGGLSLEIAETPVEWNEEEICWANAPKPDKKVGYLDINTQRAYVEVDLTDYVKEALSAGTKQISLRVSDPKSTGNKVEFGSKESKRPPMLVIQ